MEGRLLASRQACSLLRPGEDSLRGEGDLIQFVHFWKAPEEAQQALARELQQQSPEGWARLRRMAADEGVFLGGTVPGYGDLVTIHRHCVLPYLGRHKDFAYSGADRFMGACAYFMKESAANRMWAGRMSDEQMRQCGRLEALYQHIYDRLCDRIGA